MSDEKICPLSVISGLRELNVCPQEQCMFWNEKSNPRTCILRMFFLWKTFEIASMYSEGDLDKGIDESINLPYE